MTRSGLAADVASEAARRRTFAIISHPDAGKTTLTEKLLLYGGAIHLAGAVKARRASRHARSDWMALEQQRGISITSSVLQFEHQGMRVNLLDTPGHEDFSEDAYRTLLAADSAVMLLDNRKGVEPRTRQLFAVCRRRRLPVFTFVNKCDRVGTDPLRLLGDVEAELGVECTPVTWPVFRDGAIAGVLDRQSAVVHLYRRTRDHGATPAAADQVPLADDRLDRELGSAAATLREEAELLNHAAAALDPDRIMAGTQSPVHFGSALSNFGVAPFLDGFLALAPPPGPRPAGDQLVSPGDPAFSAFVFKIQANMDPRHRDRVAFLRICSGRFGPGMTAVVARTGATLRLAEPQQFLGGERRATEEAWPGDVVGIIDRGSLRIGDTVSSDPSIEFEAFPRFAPEIFARIVPTDPLRRKQLDAGLRQLQDEGTIQVFFPPGAGGASPVVGVVGQLQLDVLRFRLEHEYRAPCRLVPLGDRLIRWPVGMSWAEAGSINSAGTTALADAAGNPVLLFESRFALEATIRLSGPEVDWHEEAP